ncbi:hypothetical protein Hte_010958 [Hypoxylon texense]
MLCEKCITLGQSLLVSSDGRQTHYSGENAFLKLEVSALEGCHLCNLMLDSLKLSTYPPRKDDEDRWGDIEVSSYDDKMIVTCGRAPSNDLNHCWGGKEVPKTLKSTLGDYRKHIPASLLTKTFQDAIQITKKLMVRYLWIDSLCIVQDDASDFSRECSRMHMIYSRALCTIAAMDSENGDGGCFVPRDELRVKPCAIPFTDGPSWYKIVQVYPNFGNWLDATSGPLGSRGWSLQEYQLSPRVLIYTKKRLLWECRTHRASEDKTGMELKYGVEQVRRLLDYNPITFRSLELDQDILDRWYEMVDAYSGRDLTYPTDKLPALSGIAAVVGKLRPDDRYLAGLWRDDIIRGLSWFLDVRPIEQKHLAAYRGEQRYYKPRPNSAWPPPPLDSTMPSWSWASFNGPITHYGKHWSDPKPRVWRNDASFLWKQPLKLIKADTTLDGPHLFGRVKSGAIQLSSYCMEVTVSEANHTPAKLGQWSKEWYRKVYSIQDGYSEDDNAALYFDVDPYVLRETQFLCLQAELLFFLCPPEPLMTTTPYHNIYVYSAPILLTAYGITVCFAFLCVDIGIFTSIRSDASYTTNFSTILRVAYGAAFSGSLTEADTSEKDPTPKYVDSIIISFPIEDHAKAEFDPLETHKESDGEHNDTTAWDTESVALQ